MHSEIVLPLLMGISDDSMTINVFPIKETGDDNTLNYIQTKQIASEIVLLERVGKYNLAHKLIVEINKEDDVFISKNDYLNVWGEGETIEEAIKSLENFILYDYKSYKDTPEKELDFFARQELIRYKILLHQHR